MAMSAQVRLRPDRGHNAGARYPLCRHQSRDRIGRACLPDDLLRPRPGREPDQAAQGSARLRSYQLPQPARQPDAPDPAYRRVLADPHRPDAIPKAHALATAEFATLRLRLLKLGTRVIETACRVRLAFAAACPEAPLIRHIAAGLMPAAP